MKVHDKQFQRVNPVLPVNDIKETVHFYEEKQGFTVDVIWEDPHYACVSRGGVMLESEKGQPEHVASGVCYIPVKNAEEIYQFYHERTITHTIN